MPPSYRPSAFAKHPDNVFTKNELNDMKHPRLWGNIYPATEQSLADTLARIQNERRMFLDSHVRNTDRFKEKSGGYMLGGLAIVPFQLPASPIMEGIIDLHNDVFLFLVFIVVFVLYFLVAVIWLFKEKTGIPLSTVESRGIKHNTMLEFIWTTIPTIILCVIAVPTFTLIYSSDEQFDPAVTLKVIGRQWYWSYEYTDTVNLDKNDLNINIVFDSYLDTDIEMSSVFRLVKVDQDVYLPIRTFLRILVTSTDVIHSWAVPSLGIKVDACPGRLNQLTVFIQRVGQFFGQCSELCGLNHAFMPISVVGVPLEIYLQWVSQMSFKDSSVS